MARGNWCWVKLGMERLCAGPPAAPCLGRIVVDSPKMLGFRCFNSKKEDKRNSWLMMLVPS